jgi:hypothetical protein
MADDPWYIPDIMRPRTSRTGARKRYCRIRKAINQDKSQPGTFFRPVSHRVIGVFSFPTAAMNALLPNAAPVPIITRHDVFLRR